MKNTDAPPVETVGLPDWIPEAGRWHASTLRLSEQLAAEEKQLTGELRKVRQFKKLVDSVLAHIEPPK